MAAGDDKDIIYAYRLQDAYRASLSRIDDEMSSWQAAHSKGYYDASGFEPDDDSSIFLGCIAEFSIATIAPFFIAQYFSINLFLTFLLVFLSLPFFHLAMVYTIDIMKKTMINLRKRYNKDKRLEELNREVLDLKAAMDQLKLQINANTRLNNDKIDCNHWMELLKVHKDSLKVLEIKQAQMSISLPVHEIIDIKTRKDRISELERLISQNCRSSSLIDSE